MDDETLIPLSPSSCTTILFFSKDRGGVGSFGRDRYYVGNGTVSFLWRHPQCPLHSGAHARTGHRCCDATISLQDTEKSWPHPDPEIAMGHCMRHMLPACFLTTFTTAAGFCSPLVAEPGGLRLCAHAATMVMVAFVAVILVVPCWLAFIPASRIGAPAQSSPKEKAFLPSIAGCHSPKAIALGAI